MEGVASGQLGVKADNNQPWAQVARVQTPAATFVPQGGWLATIHLLIRNDKKDGSRMVTPRSEEDCIIMERQSSCYGCYSAIRQLELPSLSPANAQAPMFYQSSIQHPPFCCGT